MTREKCEYCSNDLHPGAAACSECGALVNPMPPTAGLPSTEGGVPQEVPWAGSQQPQQPPPAGNVPQQPWTDGQQPQQPPPASTDPVPTPETTPETAKSFDDYVKKTSHSEPISLAKIWSGLGAVAGSVLVAMMVYFYFFGFSQCGNCSSQSAEPIGLDDGTNGQITSFTNHRIYQLQLFDPANVAIAVNGDFDNYLEIYAGEGDTPMATDDDSGPGLNALLTLQLQPGIYYILVRPFSEGTGNFVLSVTSR